jgi:hypothetical protein
LTPAVHVAEYLKTAVPPLLAGAANCSAAVPLPAEAESRTGAPGTEIGATGVAAFDAGETALVPTQFVAVTLQV